MKFKSPIIEHEKRSTKKSSNKEKYPLIHSFIEKDGSLRNGSPWIAYDPKIDIGAELDGTFSQEMLLEIAAYIQEKG